MFHDSQNKMIDFKELEALEEYLLDDLFNNYPSEPDELISNIISVFVVALTQPQRYRLTTKSLTLEEFLSNIFEPGTSIELVQKLILIGKKLGSPFLTQLINLDMVFEIHGKYPINPRESSGTALEPQITPLIISKLLRAVRLPDSTVKKRGEYYTSTNDAEFIVKLPLHRIMEDDRLKDTKVRNVTVLDPACGTGAFLMPLMRMYSQFFNETGLSIDFMGIDTDAQALFIAAFRWFLFCISEKIETGFQIHLFNEDYLLSEQDPWTFDLILGNPPWVRHEDIGSNLPSTYKSNLINWALGVTDIKFDQKSDLYIYFCLKALTQLKKTGILTFLTSNAWLEVKYGKSLQAFLLNPQNQIKNIDILHQRGKRLWKDLGINSVILMVEKGENIEECATYFTESSVPFINIPLSSLEKGILVNKEYSDSFYRRELISISQLKETHKWAGNFLRASSRERMLLQKLKKKGKPLKELAEVRFAIKTGANDFFYLQKKGKKSMSPNIIEVSNKAGYQGFIELEFLKPLVKGPGDIKGYHIQKNRELENYVFHCSLDLKQLDGSYALEYIKWANSASVKIKQGKKKGAIIRGFSNLESVKQRDPWYSIPSQPYPDLLWVKSYHNSSGCIISEGEVIPDQRFYSLKIIDKQFLYLILIFLNSSYVWAQMEMEGNTNMGFGVLDTNVYWLKSIKIPVELIEKQEKLETLASRLLALNGRYNMNQESKIRREIDLFFAAYFDYSPSDLEDLYAYIKRNLSARLNKIF